MSEQSPFDACNATGALRIEHSDIPLGLTLREWREACAAERRSAEPARRSLLAGLRRALRLA